MAEFLVKITVRPPHDMPEARLAELVAAERVRGRELVESGAIQRIWRLPGGVRNVGIWRAADATELHQLLRSIPLAPWCEMEVTALATHPLEGGPEV
jgi:muconolactone D-isomerase